MALRARDVLLAGVAGFVAWGYATHWFPAIRFAGHGIIVGALLSGAGLLALILSVRLPIYARSGPIGQRQAGSTNRTNSNDPLAARTKAPASTLSRPPANPPRRHRPPVAFVSPENWSRERTALRARLEYHPEPLYPPMPRVSAAVDTLLASILRQNVRSWYTHISSDPTINGLFPNQVEITIRGALAQLRDRMLAIDDVVEVLTGRLVPLLTAHFHDFNEAERAVRGRKLNRSVTESDELDLAIAAKYRELREARAAATSASGTTTHLPKGLHPAAQLSYSAANTRIVQQDYLRRLVGERLLPELLPAPFLASRPVAALVREIVACAVLYPLMQTLSEPDTWNQLMENYGRTMLQDRSTVRRLRAALDQHASSTAVLKGGGHGRDSSISASIGQDGGRGATAPAAFPRLTPGDSERRFERFVRAIRKTNNLSDARRFRSEVASQLKRDSQQQIQDLNSGNSNSNPELVVYLRRLEMSKRLLDQKVQYLASVSGVRGANGVGAVGANGSAIGSVDGSSGTGTPGGGIGTSGTTGGSAGGPGSNPLAGANIPTVSRLETASLAELLRDASALSYFMEYMDRQRMMPLVQFWLVVDGFRNPLEEEDEEEEEGDGEKKDTAISTTATVFPPWTESDRLDLAQIDQAYLARPELHISASSRKAVRGFLESGKKATPEQYYMARRAILRCQTAVLNEMKAKHFQGFKKSDLFYKCLAAEESAQQRKQARNNSITAIERTIERAPSPLNRVSSPANVGGVSAKALPSNPARRLPRLHSTDMRTSTTAGSNGQDDFLFPSTSAGRRSLDGPPSHTPNSPSPLFGDDEDFFAHPRGGGGNNLSNSTGHLPSASVSATATAGHGHDPMADSVHSLGGGGEAGHDPNVPDTKVVQAVEDALTTIMEDRRPTTAEDLRASLFGSEDGTAVGTDRADRGSIFSGIDADSNNTSTQTSRRNNSTTSISTLANASDARRGSAASTAGQQGQHINPHAHALLLHGDNSGKPSLASLGLVSAASRIGVFDDDDLFGDDQAKYLSDDEGDVGSPDLAGSGLLEPPAKAVVTSSNNATTTDSQHAASDDDVHEAAPGDLGLVEAIAGLADDIDRLTAQDAVVDSLLKKAELTNNTAELRILRKSKASLLREIRRKELQRQQYVLQETDSSLYGRATVRLTDVHSGKEEDTGKEYAVYVIEVQRLTDSGGAAQSNASAGSRGSINTKNTVAWTVARRYSAFWALHQRLRGRYPSVRALDFPRRRVVLNKLQGDFLAKRRVALERYLRALLLLPDVCRSRELRAFLSQRSIERAGRANGADPGITGVAAGVNGFDDDRRDVISRLYDSVADGMEDILGSIPVLDQLSAAGQNLIAAAASQLGANSGAAGGGGAVNAASESALEAAEMAAAAAAAGEESVAPFVKPICDIFLEVFELNRGNNWLRGRAVVVVLQQLLGGTIERKLRENVRNLLQEEEALLKYVGLVQDSLFPASGVRNPPRTAVQKARTRNEAGLMLATLVPDLAGSVVGRVNAQAASRRIFATFNNSRLNAHLMFTILDEAVDVLFGEAGRGA
ncbi:intermediate filament protein [Ophiostoma piceae UAMH 11346]|uniref:Intermediate filament protein n=1 Tax=Ophiostoma piceae (strain UAMH 11346) TaxID=1262450 RepID=S3C802_OPHP1|nr:intermediate filament protein [Ophiostoma piceae UAMH 11346]